MRDDGFLPGLCRNVDVRQGQDIEREKDLLPNQGRPIQDRLSQNDAGQKNANASDSTLRRRRRWSYRRLSYRRLWRDGVFALLRFSAHSDSGYESPIMRASPALNNNN